MKNMSLALSILERGIASGWARGRSLSSAEKLIESDSARGVRRAKVVFVLNVKGEPDIFGINAKHGDIE